MRSPASSAWSKPSVQHLIGSLNQAIIQSASANNFVSFVYAEIDGPSGLIEYVNAGHNPPMLVRSSGEVDRLPAGGLILGVVPAAKHERREVEMRPGDLLVAFSDGVTETQNEAGEEFGEDRLIGLLLQERTRSASFLQDLVADSLRNFAGAAPQQWSL